MAFRPRSFNLSVFFSGRASTLSVCLLVAKCVKQTSTFLLSKFLFYCLFYLFI